MGKSYSLWDGNKKIGDIYENEPFVDTASLKNIEALAKQLLGEDEETLKKEAELEKKREKEREKEKRIKEVLDSMTAQEKVEYEQILEKLKSNRKDLHNQYEEQKKINKQKDAKVEKFRTLVTIILFAPLIWFSFKVLSTGFSIGNIIFLALVLAFCVFLIWLVGICILGLHNYFTELTVTKIKNKINAIDNEIFNLPLNFKKHNS